MKNTRRLLLIEDEEAIALNLKENLEDEGFEVTVRFSGDEGLEEALEERFDIVLSDIHLPKMNGLDVIKQIHEEKPELPMIIMTAHGTSDNAIEATKRGAYDYILKPFETKDLLSLLEQALRSSRLKGKRIELDNPETTSDAIVGRSPPMQEIFKQIGRLAAKNITVLVRGETGSGKELIANALVQHSDRHRNSFVTVNCAAIPETLLESELFGHEKGAFTGAVTKRIGRFEQADGGTIFLDEIGELTLPTQAKLLRVLQEKKIQRLGSKETISINVRVIAATHRNLEDAVRKGDYREDLYYRLSVAEIQVPPLRERSSDIEYLVRYFLAKCGRELQVKSPSIQPEAMEFYQSSQWPGNVRELQNSVRKALLASKGYPITLQEAQDSINDFNDCEEVLETKNGTVEGSSGNGLKGMVHRYVRSASKGEKKNVLEELKENLEREAFSSAIHLAHGNKSKAARWLGVSLPTMREKLNHFSLQYEDGSE